MHPQRVTDLCGFWAGNAVTVNGEHYPNMITEFWKPALEGMCLDEIWNQILRSF